MCIRDRVKLARIAGARLVLARAEGIDRETARVLVTGRAPIAYDILSIDVGITSDMPALPGFTTHAVPAKPLDGFADCWESFARTTEAGKVKADVAVLGGGLAGVELALAARHRTRPVGDADNGDLGFVAVIRDAGDQFLFHDFILINNQRSRGIREAR